MLWIAIYALLMFSSYILILFLGISILKQLKAWGKIVVLVVSCLQLAILWYEAYVIPANEFSVLEVFGAAGIFYAAFIIAYYYIQKTKKLPSRITNLISILVVILVNVLVYLFNQRN